MRVDEAGHQGATSEVDALAALQGDRPVGHVADGAAFDDDRHAREGVIQAAVEEGGVFEDEHGYP